MDPFNLPNNFESDDEIEEFRLYRNPKVFKVRPNYFEEYDELEFFKRFRLQKQTCAMLLGLIRDEITSATDRNNAIHPETKIFLTLRFYATGCMLLTTGDFTGVSKTSACIIVTQVTEAIASLRPRFVKLPEGEMECQRIKEEFYSIARFPKVIGTIDCTHVRIISPGGDQAERIMDIVARWPGSSHDQTIYNNSRLKGTLESGRFGTSVLLGDSGYGNTNFLITPLEHPNTRAEALYLMNPTFVHVTVWKGHMGYGKEDFPFYL
ncbi:putative nuclease HARBI1 [Sitophilus oryzae]|uniref:Nuclease HARBI1 n=1 Tax=Sitophilus oryzae TaxID=7048 RepID=A0A6J2XNC6_SITOR|nr:putative nuclease HARBI1 [Sitophilus oryzae]